MFMQLYNPSERICFLPCCVALALNNVHGLPYHSFNASPKNTCRQEACPLLHVRQIPRIHKLIYFDPEGLCSLVNPEDSWRSYLVVFPSPEDLVNILRILQYAYSGVPLPSSAEFCNKMANAHCLKQLFCRFLPDVLAPGIEILRVCV